MNFFIYKHKKFVFYASIYIFACRLNGRET
jgi:hypothetical protein